MEGVDWTDVDWTDVDWTDVDWTDVDWTDVAQNRDTGSCECGNKPSGSIKYGEFLDWQRTY
jgi:hypothetical protein